MIAAEGKPVELFIQAGETLIHPKVYYLGWVKGNLIGYRQKSLSKSP